MLAFCGCIGKLIKKFLHDHDKTFVKSYADIWLASYHPCHQSCCHWKFCRFLSQLQKCNFIKNRIQHKCFLVKFAKFLGTSILKNICERLLPCVKLYFRPGSQPEALTITKLQHFMNSILTLKAVAWRCSLKSCS